MRKKTNLAGIRSSHSRLAHHARGLAPIKVSAVQLFGIAGDDIELIGVAHELVQSIETAEASMSTALEALRSRLEVKA